MRMGASMADGGFINRRTGKYVSPERAHQHVGESFGGFEKARSKTSGNFYMRPDNGLSTLSSDALSFLTGLHESKMWDHILDNFAKTLGMPDYNLSTEERIQKKMESLDAKVHFLSIISKERPEETPSLRSDEYDIDITRYVSKQQIEQIEQTKSLKALRMDIRNAADLASGALCAAVSDIAEMAPCGSSVNEAIQRIDSERSDQIELWELWSSSKGIFSRSQRKEMLGEFWEHSQNAYSEASRFLTEQVKRCLEDGRLDDALRICETMPLYVSKELSEEISRYEEALKKDELYREAYNRLLQGKYAEAHARFLELGEWKDSAAKASEAARQIELANEAEYKRATELFETGRYHQARIAYHALVHYKDSRSLEKEAILLESHLKRALNCLQNGMPYSAQKILMEEDRRLSSSPLARSILSIIHETDLLHRKLFSDKCHKKELRNTLLNYKSILYRPLPAASDYWQVEGYISSLKRTLEETSALHFRKRSSLEKDISDQTMLLARIYERYDQERRQRNAQMIPSILQIQQKMAFIKEDERRIKRRLEELETYIRSLTVE